MLEGKEVYMEFAGNLVPVLQSGDQPRLHFKAFRENRLAFTMRLRDPVNNYLIFIWNTVHDDVVGRRSNWKDTVHD